MLYVRFPLSLWNVEDLLDTRGIDASHGAARFRWHRFGPLLASEIRKRRIQGMRSSRRRWHLDETCVKINGARYYPGGLWTMSPDRPRQKSSQEPRAIVAAPMALSLQSPWTWRALSLALSRCSCRVEEPAMTVVDTRIFSTIAMDIGARPEQVTATVALLDGGDTVPFVARYRKEATGGLDDTQLRRLAERLEYLRDLEKRRASIVGEITSQGKLTDALARDIAAADTKAVLEDLYLPFKPKRRTKAMIARENGLEPLLRAILADRAADPAVLASPYVSDAVPTAKDALAGARDMRPAPSSRCRDSAASRSTWRGVLTLLARRRTASAADTDQFIEIPQQPLPDRLGMSRGAPRPAA